MMYKSPTNPDHLLTEMCKVYYFEESPIYIKLSDNVKQQQASNDDGTSCDYCGNPLEACMCVCPYCGELNGCECCLYDAVTGGG